MRALRNYRGPLELRRRKESALVWRPYRERMLVLLKETEAEGWPFQHYPGGWKERVAALICELETALADDVECHFPQRSDSNFGHLLECLTQSIEAPQALTGRQVGLCRDILRKSEDKHGVLGSADRKDKLQRLSQEAQELNRSDQLYESLLRHLESLPADRPLERWEQLEEVWPNMPGSIAKRLQRARAVSLTELLEGGQVATLSGLMKLRGGGRERARLLLEGWLNGLPYLCAQGTERERISQLLGLQCGYFAESIPGEDYAEQIEPLLRGTLYSRYYRIPGHGLVAARADLLRSLPEQQARVELRTLLGGDLFALTLLGFSPRDALSSALQCWDYCRARSALKESKSYRKLRQHREVALAWRQMVSFLSLCEEPERAKFLGSLDASEELMPHLQSLESCLREGVPPRTPLSVWM